MLWNFQSSDFPNVWAKPILKSPRKQVKKEKKRKTRKKKPKRATASSLEPETIGTLAVSQANIPKYLIYFLFLVTEVFMNRCDPLRRPLNPNPSIFVWLFHSRFPVTEWFGVSVADCQYWALPDWLWQNQWNFGLVPKRSFEVGANQNTVSWALATEAQARRGTLDANRSPSPESAPETEQFDTRTRRLENRMLLVNFGSFSPWQVNFLRFRTVWTAETKFFMCFGPVGTPWPSKCSKITFDLQKIDFPNVWPGLRILGRNGSLF